VVYIALFVLSSTTICVITVVKMLWTHAAQPSEFIRFVSYHNINVKEDVFFSARDTLTRAALSGLLLTTAN